MESSGTAVLSDATRPYLLSQKGEVRSTYTRPGDSYMGRLQDIALSRRAHMTHTVSMIARAVSCFFARLLLLEKVL